MHLEIRYSPSGGMLLCEGAPEGSGVYCCKRLRVYTCVCAVGGSGEEGAMRMRDRQYTVTPIHKKPTQLPGKVPLNRGHFTLS